MRRRIILHIGLPKCGSTFLQTVLQRNATALAAQGVAYPAGPTRHAGNAADIAQWTNADLDHRFGGAHTLILSHEDLFSLAPRGVPLAAMTRAAQIEVQVLAYLRPFSGYIFGDYSQHMKQHNAQFLAQRSAYGGRTFEQFAQDRARALTPALFLRAWQVQFAETPIRLAAHTRIRAEIEALLPGVSIDWDMPRAQANPSLLVADCEALSTAINDPAVPPRRVRALLKAAFANALDPAAAAMDLGRTPQRIAWLETLFARKNADLLARFGFDNRLPSSPDAETGAHPD